MEKFNNSHEDGNIMSEMKDDMEEIIHTKHCEQKQLMIDVVQS